MPAFLYMGLIFALSSFAIDAPSIRAFPFQDKGVHFVEYAALGFLCAHATLNTWPQRHPFRTLALGAFLATAWGLSDEFHQAFVPGRSADHLDLLADAIGATTGASARGLLRWFAARRARAAEIAEETPSSALPETKEMT